MGIWVRAEKRGELGRGFILLLMALLLLGIGLRTTAEVGEPLLPLELPSVGELAGFTGGLGLCDLSLGRIAAGGPAPPALPVPAGLDEGEASRLDPLLRIILQRDREARQRGEALNLARFAPLVEVYAGSEPLLPPPLPTGMGQFLPPKPHPPQAAWAGKIGVLVRTRSSSAVMLSGAEAVNRVGEITVARVTLTQLRRLAQSPDVIYIEAAHRLAPELDRSIPAIGADLLHQEEPIVKGAGVIIGDVDTGIDYEHLDFRTDRDNDGFEESSRILYIWDQTETGPFGDRAGVPFGTEYTRAEIEADLARGLGPEEGTVRERDDHGHGTHVLGIAAGDGSSSGAGYVGVAPEA
jgi:subtilisin family serine protease